MSCSIRVSINRFYNFGARSRWHPLLSLPPPFLLNKICHSVRSLYMVLSQKRANLCLSGNHIMTEYGMSGEPYSQKSGW